MAIYALMSSNNSSTSSGGICIAVVVFLVVLIFMCWLCHRQSSESAEPDAAAVTAAFAARPRAPTVPAAPYWDDVEQATSNLSHRDNGHPRRASPTAGLPSFTYNQSVRHNVAGRGEEAAACSVCLGVFQVGETVRLLPVCLHLYHVECIDPWLDAHSTCPICRSGTDSTMDNGLVPSV